VGGSPVPRRLLFVCGRNRLRSPDRHGFMGPDIVALLRASVAPFLPRS
jgi:predicted protein tyrosine phosphatase